MDSSSGEETGGGPSVDASASGEERWRLFIAIELPDAIRESVVDVQDRLRKAFRFTACTPAWTPSDTLHLTLRFLGDVSAELVPLVVEGLLPIAAATEAPRMRAMGLGVFPDWKRPRVLWTGVRDKNERLIPLQRSVEDWVRSMGFEAEAQPYRPHLTLARFRSLKATHAVRGIARTHDNFRTELFTPPFVSLMRSQLQEGGAKHTRLASAPFAPVRTAEPDVAEGGEENASGPEGTKEWRGGNSGEDRPSR